MSVQCPKCHASRASLEKIAEHLENGTILQTVRCIMCGERRSRVVNRYRALAVQRIPTVERRCELVGCNTPLNPRNNTGLCKKHGKALWTWRLSKRTRPAPYIRSGNQWVPNPQREEVPA